MKTIIGVLLFAYCILFLFWKITKAVGEPDLNQRKKKWKENNNGDYSCPHNRRDRDFKRRLAAGDDCGLTPKAAAKYRKRLEEGDIYW